MPNVMFFCDFVILGAILAVAGNFGNISYIFSKISNFKVIFSFYFYAVFSW